MIPNDLHFFNHLSFTEKVDATSVPLMLCDRRILVDSFMSGADLLDRIVCFYETKKIPGFDRLKEYIPIIEQRTKISVKEYMGLHK